MSTGDGTYHTACMCRVGVRGDGHYLLLTNLPPLSVYKLVREQGPATYIFAPIPAPSSQLPTPGVVLHPHLSSVSVYLQLSEFGPGSEVGRPDRSCPSICFEVGLYEVLIRNRPSQVHVSKLWQILFS